MQKLWFALLGFVVALLLPRPAWLQTAAKPPAVSGKAVDIKASEIQADAQKTGRGIVQMLRVVDINHGEYNVGFAVLLYLLVSSFLIRRPANHAADFD